VIHIKLLKKNLPYILMISLGGVAFIDLQSPPEFQVSSSMYLFAVKQYQTYGHSVLKGRVACRYKPTCSNYSIKAVERYGILKGLALTFNRLSRCTDKVSPNTVDPVP